MRFTIIHNGKHVKYYHCDGIAEANKECRAVECDYRLPKYTVKAVKVLRV